MDYFLFGAGMLTGGLLVFFIFKKNILSVSVVFKRPYKQKYDASEDFYRLLNAKTDFSLYKNSVEAIELDRQRIGADIHDEMAPYLGSLFIDLELVSKESDVLSFKARHILMNMSLKLESTIDSLRRIISGMLPPALVNSDLVEAVFELCQNHDGIKGTNIIFENNGEPSVLPDQHQLFVYRIIQELINNSLKHSPGWVVQVQVHLDWSETELRVTVSDDGVGFSNNIKNGSRFGLTGIFVRSKIIGATAYFNAPEKGLEFVLKLPLKNQSFI